MSVSVRLCSLSFFFFNDTATTEIYTLSLHDALPISLLPAPRRRSPVRLAQDVARGRRGGAALRQGGRGDHPVRDELSAPLPGFRGERPRLLAPRRPAELEQLVRGAVAASELAVPDRVLELQLVAILDGRRVAARARCQHQCSRAAQEPLVAARRHDT